MIEKINNFTEKSFENYSGPNDIFVKNNIIFGYNGRGKSTLANGIAKIFNNNSKNKDGLRFYNRDYVDSALILHDGDGTKKIKGVVANFGKKDVRIEHKIKELESQRIDVDSLRNKQNNQKIELRKDIDTIHDRRKGTAGISKKPVAADVLQVVKWYSEDLEKALLIEPSTDKLAMINGDGILENKITQLKGITIRQPQVHITPDELQRAKKIFQTIFSDNVIPVLDVIKWINDGVVLHKTGNLEKCQFCGGNINIKEVENKLAEYNNDKKQKSAATLDDILSKLKDILDVVKDNEKTKPILMTLMDNSDNVEDDYKKINKSLAKLQSGMSALEDKIKDITNTSIEYIDIANDIETIFEKTKDIQDKINEEVSVLADKNSKIERLVKGAIGLEIKNSKTLQDRITQIRDLETEISNSVSANIDINSKIDELKKQKNAVASFALFITNILKELGMRFEVVVDNAGQNYIIELANSNKQLDISDISEGEKNILALLFFYYELFEDNQLKSIKNNIELIIIDDPVSSLDDVNHLYIISLIEQILEMDRPQVFMFTHSWEDFATISYKFKEDGKNPKNRFYEIRKNHNGQSEIVKVGAVSDPYSHHFREVFAFTQRPSSSDLSDCDIYHMPNIMRQVLEGFLKFKVKNNRPTKANESTICKILFPDEWPNVSANNRTRLSELLLNVNINSHHSTRNPEELLRSAKFLMNRIKKVDKEHFEAYKNE